MKKLITFALLALTLTGCSFFRTHKMDIEQGNIITQANIERLKIGMSEGEVRDIMGNPVLVNIFTPNRLDYIYTFQTGYTRRVVIRVICVFKHGRLKEILSNG